MALVQPNSMEECLYFTRRDLENDGSLFAWVYKKKCPECGKAKMGKPIDEKTGKPKIRAKEYVCPECGHTEEKVEHEESCNADIIYTCKCGHEGEISIPYKRKKVQLLNEKTGKKKAADALIFHCSKCNERILITKKLKS
jgi:predicted RNA-binding Zn-ribbon protein involved in translation (DUF1610 family)